MAYELNPQLNKDEEDPNAPQGGQAGGGALISGGGGENKLASGSTPSAPSPGGGGGFANVKDYLDANKTQAEGLAGQISGRITSQGNDVRNQIKTAGDNFNQAADKNTVRLDQNLLTQAKENPVGFAQNQGNVQNFAAQRDAAYKGPQDLSGYGYGDLQSKAKSAMDYGNLVDTDQGREQLLSAVSKRPTAGTNALNNLLLAGQPTALQTLQGAKKGVSDLSSYLDSVNSQAKQRAQEAQTTTAATKKAVADQFMGQGGVIPGLQSSIDKRVADMKNQAATLNQAPGLLSQGKADQLSDAQLNALGINRQELGDVLSRENRLKDLGGNFDISPYMSARSPDAEISAANAASPDELARLNALEGLFGENSPYGYESNPNAGTANPDLVNFKKSDAFNDLGSMLKEAEINNAAKQAEDFYYGNIGQHTGEGYLPARNGREVPTLAKDLLNSGRQLTPDEINQYFYKYAPQTPGVIPSMKSAPPPGGLTRDKMDEYLKGFNDLINQARGRVSSSAVPQVKNPNIALK